MSEFLRFKAEQIWVHISSTFSVLRPLYFDILSNLDFLLDEKYRSKYSLVELKFCQKSRSKVGEPKYRKGRADPVILYKSPDPPKNGVAASMIDKILKR